MKYIRIGKVINTHGIKGEAKIYSYSDFDDERYVKGNTVWMKHGEEMIPLTVKTYRVHKGFPLVSFEELKDINAVEPYRNCELYITDDMREELEEGYYYDELEDLEAFDQDGNRLGVTIGIEETNGAQDNLRIAMDNGRSFLVPYIDEFIEEVDLDHNRIVTIMTPIPTTDRTIPLPFDSFFPNSVTPHPPSVITSGNATANSLGIVLETCPSTPI